MDVSPEPEGTEHNPYFETLEFEAIGDVENAESQVLAVLRYQQIVRRKSNDKVFHDQTGYWTWDAEAGVIVQSLTIPRAVCLLAGGVHSGAEDPAGTVRLAVQAELGDPDWGILQSPFMREKARTLKFNHEVEVDGDQLSYSETTLLDIYGRTFEHTDKNVLTRR